MLMDVQMPGLDGYQTTEELRRREGGGRRTPVIALTAGVTDAERERSLASGMDDFLAKPMRKQDVADALGALGHSLTHRPTRWRNGPGRSSAGCHAPMLARGSSAACQRSM